MQKGCNKTYCFTTFPRLGEHSSRAYFIITTARCLLTLAVLQAAVKRIKEHHSVSLCANVAVTMYTHVCELYEGSAIIRSVLLGEEIKSRAKQAGAMKSCVFNDMHLAVEDFGPCKMAALLSVKEVTGSHEYLLCTRLIITTSLHQSCCPMDRL